MTAEPRPRNPAAVQVIADVGVDSTIVEFSRKCPGVMDGMFGSVPRTREVFLIEGGGPIAFRVKRRAGLVARYEAGQRGSGAVVVQWEGPGVTIEAGDWVLLAERKEIE